MHSHTGIHIKNNFNPIYILMTGKMRSEEDRFTPFIANDSFTNMESYCKKEVEPMGKECEQVHIIAIAEYMGVAVQIDYLDGRYNMK